MVINSYQDLNVWKQAIELCDIIYDLTDKYPKKEIYGLTNQMRRCAISVPSNIAEGFGRRSTGDYLRFLKIALGSLSELETQIIISVRRKYLNSNFNMNQIIILKKMINKMISGIYKSTA